MFSVEDTTGNQPVPQNQNKGIYLNTCEFHEKDILRAISNMKINKIPAPGKVSPRLHKEEKN